MIVRLALQPIAYSRRGPIFGTGDVIEYRVTGMPPEQEAFIANFGGPKHNRWRILQVKRNIQGEWSGDHKTLQEALLALHEDVWRMH